MQLFAKSIDSLLPNLNPQFLAFCNISIMTLSENHLLLAGFKKKACPQRIAVFNLQQFTASHVKYDTKPKPCGFESLFLYKILSFKMTSFPFIWKHQVVFFRRQNLEKSLQKVQVTLDNQCHGEGSKRPQTFTGSKWPFLAQHPWPNGHGDCWNIHPRIGSMGPQNTPYMVKMMATYGCFRK